MRLQLFHPLAQMVLSRGNLYMGKDQQVNKSLKLQFVTFGALEVNKHNCMHLAEEHYSRSYFSLFMSMINQAGTGLLHSSTYPN